MHPVMTSDETDCTPTFDFREMSLWLFFLLQNTPRLFPPVFISKKTTFRENVSNTLRKRRNSHTFAIQRKLYSAQISVTARPERGKGLGRAMNLAVNVVEIKDDKERNINIASPIQTARSRTSTGEQSAQDHSKSPRGVENQKYVLIALGSSRISHHHACGCQ